MSSPDSDIFSQESQEDVGAVDQGLLAPTTSHSVPGLGQSAGEGEGDNADVAPRKIGKPSPDFSIRESVAYSHNYFEAKEVYGESYALCLLCDREEKQAESSGKTPKKQSRKKKQLKTSDDTTKRKY